MAETEEVASCRLLALPRELRDLIYEYTFSSMEIPIKDQGPFLQHPVKKPTNHGLVLASKQLYNETLDLYYKHTQFAEYSHVHLCNWFDSIPLAAHRLIKPVKLYVVVGGCLDGIRSEAVVEYERRSIDGRLQSVGLGRMIEKVELEMECRPKTPKGSNGFQDA